MGYFSNYLRNKQESREREKAILAKKQLSRDELRREIYPELNKIIDDAIDNVVKYVIVHFDQTTQETSSITETERSAYDIKENRLSYVITLRNKCFDDSQVLYQIKYDYEQKGFECDVRTHVSRHNDHSDGRPINYVEIDCSKSIRGR